MPGWSLNTTVDDLLKKEFDFIEKEKPHPIFKDYNLNYIPYQHEDIDRWKIHKGEFPILMKKRI